MAQMYAKIRGYNLGTYIDIYVVIIPDKASFINIKICIHITKILRRMIDYTLLVLLLFKNCMYLCSVDL